KDCYSVLGILYENYIVVKGTLKDYIANPKPNGYKSLHSVLEVQKRKIEVQIRTKEMDEIAEEGIAAHWSYKKLKSDVCFEKKIAWLRSVLELEKGSNQEFLKNLKQNLFGDRFYCYTPKGKAINLPEDSSVLDFAYYVHREVGNHAVGGRINGIFVSLSKKLKSGDVVEIITNKHQRPRRNWVKYVASSRARCIIRNEVKKIEHLPVTKSFVIKKKESEKFESLVFSDDFPNHKFNLAKCCAPVPKKEIVGVIKSHKVILVHNKNCDSIKRIKDKLIPIFWKESFNRLIKIIVKASDRSGILADLLNTITQGGFIVKEANAKLLYDDISECFFVVVPQKLEHIVKLIKRIEKVRGVKGVRFD
ncbi:TGS domain-containing protein, partial [Nanoarchaeota archaeon]